MHRQCSRNTVIIGPLTAEICFGHPSKFQRVSRLRFPTAPTSLNGSQPNFARCFAVSWVATLYIHFRGILPPNGILLDASFTLRPRLAFSYIRTITARHSSSGHQPNFAVCDKKRNYGTFAPQRETFRMISLACAGSDRRKTDRMKDM